jgi:sulfatase modifying factor 1
MLTQVKRKIIQKNVKKYSELRILKWWNSDIVSYLHKYSHLGKQRYSKGTMLQSFEHPNIQTDLLIPYYKVDNTIYNLIPCPSGIFIKGHENESNNQPQEMAIKKPFLLGETEITQELYCAVMGVENPSYFRRDNPKNPVEYVSWYDALIFCNKLSDMFKFARYYRITKGGQIVDTIEKKQERNYVVEMNEKSKGFRLPTEWEWEYAAKAGTPLEYSGSNNVDDVGWYKDNSGGTTHEIKGKNPNAWGFYDMSGNVWEWCENTHDPNNTDISALRVYRGGGWNYDAWYLCSAGWDDSSTNYRIGHLGFRVCKYI